MGPDPLTEQAAMVGPRLYQPVSPLADYVEYIGRWCSRGADYRSRALPRGAVTVIFDIGHRQRLNFYAAPAALVEDRGWTPTVTDAAEPGNRRNRWAHPAVPADVPGAPRGYFVEAIKA
jgi:hypothetical protein